MTEVEAGTGKRELTKAANRSAILRAGVQVFAEMGYGAASVRDIVRRTNLASGTFYNYFPDKEAVLREVMADVAAAVRVRARAARRGATDLEGFVSGGFRAYYEVLAADRATFELLRRNAGTIRALSDEPWAFAGLTELEEDLAAAAGARGLRPTELRYLAGAMVGAGFEVAVLMLDREPPDVEGAVALITELFVGGIERLGDRVGATDPGAGP